MEVYEENYQFKDSDDELLSLLWEGNANASQSSEEDFDAFAYSRLCSTPIKESTSPRGKEFLEFCNYFNDPSRPSSSACQEEMATTMYSTKSPKSNLPDNDSWPPVFLPRYRQEDYYEDFNYQESISRSQEESSSMMSSEFMTSSSSRKTNDNQPYETNEFFNFNKPHESSYFESLEHDHETCQNYHSYAYANQDTNIKNPSTLSSKGLNWAAKVFTPSSQIYKPTVTTDTTTKQPSTFNNNNGYNDFINFQFTGDIPEKKFRRPTSFRYNAAFTESTDSESEELEKPKHYRRTTYKPKTESSTAEPNSFAEIEEFAYGPIPNTKYSYSPKAQLFEILYNYHTDTSHPPASKILPIIKHNYENFYKSIPPCFPFPSHQTFVPMPPYPQQFSPPENLQSELLESIRRLRHQNLLKWWAMNSILNDKPDLLIDCELSANDSTGGLSSFNNKTAEKQKCKFCVKNGEMPIVYESHALKDFEGNITCPILQKHKCEICNATGRKAHTKKHCPYNTEQETQQLPLFRVLANGSITTNFNHK